MPTPKKKMGPPRGSEQNSTTFRKLKHLIRMWLDQESCWEWDGSVNQDGHPNFHTGGTCLAVTKVVYCHVFKRERWRMNPTWAICRSCDNLLCLRPSHMYREKFAEISKANNTTQHLKPGYLRKITREQAIEIRFSKEPGKVLAERYGLSESGVSAIRRRRYWR